MSESSLAVSRSLGYVDNSVQLHPRNGARDDMLHLRVTREQWASVERPAVSVTGFAACRPYFGL